MGNTCRDCLFYLPVDVFKGLCKLEKTSIQPDDSSCAKFDRQPKCKFCLNYTSEKDYSGSCMGIHMTYPDLNAFSCKDFKWS